MTLVHIGLGSNLGDRAANLERAVEKLGSVGRVRRVSRRFETKPEGVSGPQPDFLNAVAELETPKSPREILELLLEIEAAMGRVRAGTGEAREIDLDLLTYGDGVFREADLVVPHPRMHLRRFVLEPLAELAPGWRHPVEGKTVVELLGDL